MDVKKAAAETKDYIVSIRREFHRHPELSLQEFRTAQRIEEELAGNKVSSIFIQPDEVTGFFQYFQRNISNVGTICK